MKIFISFACIAGILAEKICNFAFKVAGLLKVTKVKDVFTGEIVGEIDKFIDGLHHKSWIVQISCLKKRRRNELEHLLSVFDQSNHTYDIHILNVREGDFPEKFRPLICRLKGAASDSTVKRQMKEDDENWSYIRHCVRSKPLPSPMWRGAGGEVLDCVTPFRLNTHCKQYNPRAISEEKAKNKCCSFVI